jgi:4-amino-4-deoxy-L-arabinose transferase-like glycosyltransferase
VTHWAVFSWAQGIFHEYYTTVMAPAVAVLAGIGVSLLWHDRFTNGGWRSFLLPIGLLLAAGWQAFIMTRPPEVSWWLLGTLVSGLGVGTAGILCLGWLKRPWPQTWAKLAGALAVAALLVGPAWWSWASVQRPIMGMMPAASPMMFAGRSGPRSFRPRGGSQRDMRKLVDFLRANRHGERFLVAAQASMAVAPIIIQSGEQAVALGGFMGADPVITKDQLAQLVADGQLRFMLDTPRGPGFGGPRPGSRRGTGPAAVPGLIGPPSGFPNGPGNNEIAQWVREHGKVVDAHRWRSDDTMLPDAAGNDIAGGRLWRRGGMQRLYDLRPELGLTTPGSRAPDDPLSKNE